MVLSKKSWHFWFYQLLFTNTPTNLCPYFWGVILSVIVAVPFFILAIPWFIYCVITDEDMDETLGQRALLGAVLWFLLILLASMFGMFFTKKDSIVTIGILGWSTVIILIIVATVNYAKHRNIFKDSFIGKFVDAKRNKYCPKIEWDDKKA